jgi:co-chaperonin GroES (HSP10)
LDPVSDLEVTIEPLDDFLVVQPLDDSETASGLIGPDVTAVEPGDKVLYPREAGYEVRLVRSPHRVRVIKREDLIARIHD